MSARTYIPQIIKIVHTVCVYCVRYDAQIRAHLPEGTETAYNALRTACTAFLDAVGTLPIGD